MSVKKEKFDRDAELSCPAAPVEPPRPEKGLKSYWWNKNHQSIDGLPGLQYAGGSMKVFPERDPNMYKKDDISTKGSWSPSRIVREKRDLAIGFGLGLLAATLYVQSIHH